MFPHLISPLFTFHFFSFFLFFHSFKLDRNWTMRVEYKYIRLFFIIIWKIHSLFSSKKYIRLHDWPQAISIQWTNTETGWFNVKFSIRYLMKLLETMEKHHFMCHIRRTLAFIHSLFVLFVFRKSDMPIIVVNFKLARWLN